jgi:hypothetical protein
MSLLNYGKEYYYSQRYIKRYKNITIPKTEHNIEYTKLFTYWSLKLIEINKGIFLGYRYIKDGYIEYGIVGNYFNHTKITKVALISPDSKRNPIYVPIDNLK